MKQAYMMPKLINTLNAILLLSLIACSKSHADNYAHAYSYATRYDSFQLTDENKYEMSCNTWGYDKMRTSSDWSIECYTWANPQRNNWAIRWENIYSTSGNETEVKAYPSIRMGMENANPSSSDGLPYQVGTKEMAIYWDFDVTGFDGTGSYDGVINATFDMFMNNDPNDGTYHDYEVMIMPYYTRGLPQAQQIAWNISVGGYQWNVFKYTMTSSYSGASWPVYQYKFVNNATYLHIHLSDILNDIHDRWSPPNWNNEWIQNMDAGVEIKWGNGKLITNEYRTDVY